MDIKDQLCYDMVFLDDRQKVDRGDFTLEEIKLFRCCVYDHPSYYSRIDEHLLAIKGIKQDCPVCQWLKQQEHRQRYK